MEEEKSEEMDQMSDFPTQKRREEVERVMQLGSIMAQEWDRSVRDPMAKARGLQ